VLILKRVLFEGQVKKKEAWSFGEERNDEITNRKKRN